MLPSLPSPGIDLVSINVLNLERQYLIAMDQLKFDLQVKEPVIFLEIWPGSHSAYCSIGSGFPRQPASSKKTSGSYILTWMLMGNIPCSSILTLVLRGFRGGGVGSFIASILLLRKINYILYE